MSRTAIHGKSKLTADEQSISFSNGIIINDGKISSISQQSFGIGVDFDNSVDKAYFYYRWDFYPNGNTSITDYSYRMNADVDGKTYSSGDAIDWTITQEYNALSAEEMGLKEGADSDFKKAIGYWNAALNEKLGISLADIGMDNCR